MAAPQTEGAATIISGRSRSGKSAWAKQAVADARRLVVWDPDDEWGDSGRGVVRVGSLSRLALLMWRHAEEGFRFRFVPRSVGQELHGAWAAIVLAWATEFDGYGIAAVSDELADVTSPGKASAGWGQLVRRGLKRGVSLYSISQRWAEADKSAFGNCSRVVAFASSSDQDVRYLSSRVRVPGDVLSGLKRLEFVDYSTVTGEYSVGLLKFSGRRRSGTDTDTGASAAGGGGSRSEHQNRPGLGLILE